ncbi:3-hydroxyacyl-CoA dehydrogenase NAD-binding domain-containing protein [Rhodovibrionaceae bacterium A322]
MIKPEDIQKVGIVGGGLIGQSWAALFCACGFQVTVYDPNAGLERELQGFVTDAWPLLLDLGLTDQTVPAHPRFTTDLTTLKDVDFVQECGPDRIEVKRQTVAELEQVIAPGVLIASSTSSLIASDIQSEANHPERILVGHPMNPPHMVPMVELVAGQETDPAAVDLADAFYQRAKRETVRVKKEVIGHLANRLTSALYREAVYIAASGIASVEDIDKAIAHGPGLRWALMGPHLTYHLGGGKGGYRHYLDHLGPTQENRWKEHGTAALTEDLKEELIAGVERELEGQDEDSLALRRDAALADLLKIKKTHGF